VNGPRRPPVVVSEADMTRKKSIFMIFMTLSTLSVVNAIAADGDEDTGMDEPIVDELGEIQLGEIQLIQTKVDDGGMTTVYSGFDAGVVLDALGGLVGGARDVAGCELAVGQALAYCLTQGTDDDCCHAWARYGEVMCIAGSGTEPELDDYARLCESSGPNTFPPFGGVTVGGSVACEETAFFVEDFSTVITSSIGFLTCECDGWVETGENEFGECVSEMTVGECECVDAQGNEYRVTIRTDD